MRRSVRRRSGVTLDAQSIEAIERFVRILTRCGASPREATRVFARACAQVPVSRARDAARAGRLLKNAPHVLTVWYSDPRYVDERGDPLSLPAHGPAPSIAAIVKRVDPQLETDEVLRYLRRNRAVRKLGKGFRPLGRELVLSGARGQVHFQNMMRGLLAMLLNLEQNTLRRSSAEGWLERFADNPKFPKRELPRLDEEIERHAATFLKAIDAQMHREELRARPGEPTVRIGVGVYRFEEKGPRVGVRRRR